MNVQRQHQNPSRIPVAAATMLAFLLAASFAGCSTRRPAWSGWWPRQSNSAGTYESRSAGKCQLPACRTPEPVVAVAPAELPLPLSSAVPAAEHVEDLPPEQVATELVAQPTLVPPVPDLPSIPAATDSLPVPEFPIAQNPEPSLSRDDLDRCQNQMAELYARFSSLEDTHEKSQQVLALLLAEQRRLKLDNERLKRELQLNHQQDIESLDSLSQILEEVVSVPAAATPETSAPAENDSNSPESTSPTRLPAVEVSL